MISVPLVWWLVLYAVGQPLYYDSTRAVAVMPVPFSSIEDCQTAGNQWGGYKYYCVQQRQSDVYDWQHPEIKPAKPL